MNTYVTEWISQQVVSPSFAGFATIGGKDAGKLVYTTPYHEGNTMQLISGAPTQNPLPFSIGYVRDYINKLPPVDSPPLFRMHQNAEINFRLNDTSAVLAILLSMQPKEGGGAKGGLTREETVLQKAKAM